MDRATVYFDQTPLETDVLRAGQYAMTGLAKLSEAVLGTAIAVAGFTVAPTVPATLSVSLGAGQVYQQENLEASAWSSLPADTHVIVKQGVLTDAVPLTFTPPPTVGYSQCFLIEVQYQDADVLPVVLPYYNAANPDVSLNGPGGNNAAQNTARKGAVAYQIKAGVATSGTPVPPTPDAGWAGLYVVTLAQGATTVTAGNIVQYASAPFIPVTLPGVPAGVQSGQWRYGIDTGAASALVVGLTPAPAALTVGMEIIVKPLFAPTGASVANVASLGNLPVVRRGGLAVQSGDWALGDMISLRYTGAAWMLSGLVPSDILALIQASAVVPATANVTLYVRPDGNDANDGSANTAAKAFKTIVAAVASGAKRFAFAGFGLIIQLGTPGTYAAPGSIVGVPNVSIIGDPANPASYLITGAGPAGGNGALIAAPGGTSLTLQGVTASNTSNINATLAATQGGFINVVNCQFTGTIATSFAHIVAANGGSIGVGAGNTILSSSFGSAMFCSGGNITLTSVLSVSGTPNFSTGFVVATGCGLWTLLPGASVTGAAYGPRYLALLNGIINTAGGGANFFPGNSAGSTNSGGQYA